MKYLFILFISIFTISCFDKSTLYYYKNPKILQEKINKCYINKKNIYYCEKLIKLAIKFNKLSMQLQQNPQDFGKKILKLQQIIANQKMIVLKNTSKKLEYIRKIKKNEEKLYIYLSIVKWLESP